MACGYRGLHRVDADAGWRQAAIGLAWFGMGLVVIGVVTILAGVPVAARDTHPIAGLGDAASRARELSLPLSAMAAAIVAGAIGALFVERRLRAPVATLELLVLAVAIELCLAASGSRVAYDASGAVLPGVVAWASGGIAVLTAALLASRARG